MMFDFITSDMRKPTPNSLKELIDREYTIVLVDNRDVMYNLVLKAVRNENKK